MNIDFGKILKFGKVLNKDWVYGSGAVRNKKTDSISSHPITENDLKLLAFDWLEENCMKASLEDGKIILWATGSMLEKIIDLAIEIEGKEDE